MVAIIPAAGKGTRMLSTTGGSPKELLPLGSKPVLARIVDECISAGVDEVVIVNSREKPEIDRAVADWIAASPRDVPIRIAYQDEPRGIAYAVACAEVDDDALVLAGDVVFSGGSPTERMANLVYRGIDGCVAVEPVEERLVGQYGIIEIDEASGSILRILEKPSPSETPSRWAVASRWAFSKRTMTLLADLCGLPSLSPSGKEFFLTDIIATAIREGLEFKAVAVQPGQSRVDCGGPGEYAAARRMSWD